LYWAVGNNTTGRSVKQSVYVDETPDLTGLTYEPLYMDGKNVPFELALDMDWEIRPTYVNKDKTGDGHLVFKIGYLADPSSSTPYNPGVMIMFPYDEVWHVTGLTVDIPQNIEDEVGRFFYWDSDDDAEWLKRYATSSAKITVTYSNGNPGPKTFTMYEALNMNKVYYNANPNGVYAPFAIEGIQTTFKTRLSNEKDAVNNTPWPDYKNPQISFYYRGVRNTNDAKVNLYNRFRSLKVEQDDRITVDVSARDNDKPKYDAYWLADQIKVFATFRASATTAETELELIFEKTELAEKDDTDRGYAAGKVFDADPSAAFASTTEWKDRDPAKFKGGPLVYSMSFGEAVFDPDTRDFDDTSSWGDCIDISNNGKNKNVMVYYAPGLDYNNLTSKGSNTPGPRSAKVTVTWKNIPKAP